MSQARPRTSSVRFPGGRLFGVLLTAALGLSIPGCASTPREPAAPALSAQQARDIPLWHGDGSGATWDELVSRAALADVVIIGENHGHPVGLPWAAALFDEVLDRSPTAALSLEFFERDDQTRVDDYLRGMTDEPTFRKRTDRTAGNYPEGHRHMLEAAKSRSRPVVASNTTWEVLRFLRGKDYDALRTLTPEQQRLFRIPEAPPEGRYRADFDAIMGPSAGMGHGATPSKDAPPLTAEQKQASLDAGFRSQYLWDWTMGDSIARAVDAGLRPVVHVVGRFHSDFRGGTPQAAARIRPGTRILLVSVVDGASDSLREQDRGRADFVVYVGPSPGEK